MTEPTHFQLSNAEDLYPVLTAPDPDEIPALTADEYRTLTVEDRDDYDNRRLDWMALDRRFHTPNLTRVETTLRIAEQRNRSRVSGRYGVLVSGYSGMGKTTAAIATMRGWLARYNGKHPGWREDGHIPIVYVEVPAGATGKAMMGRFLEFFGYDSFDSWTLEKRHAIVTHALRAHRTGLVIVDEFHNLVERSSGHQETANVLKGLSNVTGATFMYVGINIDRSRILAGETGQQIATRFIPARMAPYSIQTKAAQLEWKQLIASFESQLRLLNHPQNSLVKLSTYLFQRTHGAIGSLSYLILGAGQTAVMARNPEKEHLTREYLDTIELDLAAQAHDDESETRGHAA